jgi:ActR/RegA family two-component response regulator
MRNTTAEYPHANDEIAETKLVELLPSPALVQWDYIQQVLRICDGNISLAARRLRMHRQTLQRKLAKLPPTV